MFWLLAASLLWAFSFGLIKRFLPALDPWAVAAVRLTLATVVFSPWLVRRPPPRHLRWPALGLGALQFGLMYVCYIASFGYLAAWQVALWTVLTPVLVVLLDAVHRRRTTWRPFLAALLAVGGALVAQGQIPRGESLTGVLLVQCSNLCFAAGQLGYRRLATAGGVVGPGAGGREVGLVGWMYLGGALLVLPGVLATGGLPGSILTVDTVPVLLYLGLVPTALGFWLWNKGAARTSAGGLAVANNLKVPLAVLVSWLVFAEAAPYLRAVAGLVVMAGAVRLATVPKNRDPE